MARQRLLRYLSGLGFEIDSGQLYENYVASELMKFFRTNRLDANLSFYRTRSGMEIGFILETNKGFIGLEVKNRDTIAASDFTNLKRLAAVPESGWLGGLVIYRGNKIVKIDKGRWTIPSCRFFS